MLFNHIVLTYCTWFSSSTLLFFIAAGDPNWTWFKIQVVSIQYHQRHSGLFGKESNVSNIKYLYYSTWCWSYCTSEPALKSLNIPRWKRLRLLFWRYSVGIQIFLKCVSWKCEWQQKSELHVCKLQTLSAYHCLYNKSSLTMVHKIELNKWIIYYLYPTFTEFWFYQIIVFCEQKSTLS